MVLVIGWLARRLKENQDLEPAGLTKCVFESLATWPIHKMQSQTVKIKYDFPSH